MAGRNAVTVIVVGNVSTNREEIDVTFQHVAPTIELADIALCQFGDFHSQHDVSMANLSQVQRDCQWNSNAIDNAGFSIAAYTAFGRIAGINTDENGRLK